MALFNIWLLAPLDGKQICVDVTSGNIPQLNKPDVNWIRGIMAAIDVKGVPVQWHVTPWRCRFYSEYANSPAWEDRWPRGWSIQIMLDKAHDITRAVVLDHPHAYNMLDESWEGEQESLDESSGALILYVMQATRIAVEEQKNQFIDLCAELHIPPSSDVLQELDDELFLVRLFFKDVLFPKRISLLENLIQALRNDHLVVECVNYSSRNRH